ncbi:hypothetical protein MNBD_ALPHA12-1562 [hydrothermal vent metagenome]|uniref:DUF1127 domain-containing protein n=1 Tax=hydrothermal vent metagenome TaxID=652676 RepID=A0A3B0TTY2_9ZZZZ
MNMLTIIRHLYADWDAAERMSELDACRLSDMGLNRYDLFEARKLHGAGRGAHLDARRAERAGSWLR